MLRSRRFWLSTAVSLVFLALFLLRVDVGEMWDDLRTAQYGWVVLGLVAYFVSVFFRALRWQYLLRPMAHVGLGRLYRIVVVGYMANNVLPFRLGELVRAYYLGTKTGISKSSGLATIVVERVFDGLALLSFLLVVSFSLLLVGTLRGLGESAGILWLLLAMALSVLFVVAIVVLALLAHNPPWLQALTLRLVAVAPHRVRLRLLNVVAFFIRGLAVLRSPQRLVGVFLLSLPVWLLEALMYLLIGYSFGLNHLFSNGGELVAAMLLVTAVANMGLSIPSSPGGIGPFEFFAQGTLVLLGIEEPVASAFAIALHAALLGPVTGLGLIFLWVESVSLAQLTRQGIRPSSATAEVAAEGMVARGDETL